MFELFNLRTWIIQLKNMNKNSVEEYQSIVQFKDESQGLGDANTASTLSSI